MQPRINISLNTLRSYHPRIRYYHYLIKVTAKRRKSDRKDTQSYTAQFFLIQESKESQHGN